MVETRQTLTYWDEPLFHHADRIRKLNAQHQASQREAHAYMDANAATRRAAYTEDPKKYAAISKFENALLEKAQLTTQAIRMFTEKAKACYPLKLNHALHTFATTAMPHRKLSSGRIITTTLGSEYVVLRLAGISAQEIMDKDLLVQASLQCDYCADRASVMFAGDPFLRGTQATAGADAKGTEAAPTPFVAHQLLASGLFDRFRAGARGSRLVAEGRLPTHVSYEALGLMWPDGPAPAEMQPFMLPARRTGGAGHSSSGGGIAPDAGIAPGRLECIQVDWMVYKMDLTELLAKTLRRSGETRMLYLPIFGGGGFRRMDTGMVIDLNPDLPCIFLGGVGLFYLRSADPADDYLAWLLQMLLMSPPCNQVTCYAVLATPAAFHPQWIDIVSRHTPLKPSGGSHGKRKREEEDHA